jgi:hypothetical protein
MFGVEYLVRSIEGELETSEVSEGAPRFSGERPVEDFEAVGIGNWFYPSDRAAGAAIMERISAAASRNVEVIEPGSDLGEDRIGWAHRFHSARRAADGRVRKGRRVDLSQLGRLAAGV